MIHNKQKKLITFSIFIAIFALTSAVVMLLWNAIIPSVIGCTSINYWQAAGLIILSRLLLGGFGKLQQAGFMFGKFGKDSVHHHAYMKDVRKKMQEMNSEERKEFIKSRIVGFDEGTCNKEN